MTRRARFSMALLLCAAFSCSALGGSAPAQGIFADCVDYAAGNTPRAAASGDFNDDGDPDIVVANYLGQNLSLYIGDGFGGFAGQTMIGNGTGPWNIAVGDFNEDGDDDLAVVNKVSDDVKIHLSNGNGTFQSAQTFDTTAERPLGIAVGDFDEDTHLDVAICGDMADHVEIFLGDGTGSLSSNGTIDVGSDPGHLAASDMNHNGHIDLLVANAGSNTVSVLEGNGNGGFTVTNTVSVGLEPVEVAVADFNEDTHRDFVTCNFGSRNVSVAFGDGLGGFGSISTQGAGTDPLGLGVGDFDGDHNADIITANSRGDDLTIILGDGLGGFSAAANKPVAAEPHGLTIADFDDSGVDDVAVADWGSDEVTVCLSIASPSAVAVSTFSALQEEDGVQLSWDTRFEEDHLGFHVERALVAGSGTDAGGSANDAGTSDGTAAETATDFEPINSELVRPPSPYSFLDRDAESGNTYIYRLVAVDRSGGSEVAASLELQVTNAGSSSLRPRSSLYPSAGRAPITIAIELDSPQEVTVEVYDVAGRRVETVAAARLGAGSHTFTWDGRGAHGDVTSGIYFVSVSAGAASSIQKLTLLR